MAQTEDSLQPLAEAADSLVHRGAIHSTVRRAPELRRSFDWRRVDLGEIDVATESNDETLIFGSEALERLALKDPVCAGLIKLRFFVGIPNHQAAEMLGLSERTPNAIGLTRALGWRKRLSTS